jgi:Outer membrane protein beta-barrel domain
MKKITYSVRIVIVSTLVVLFFYSNSFSQSKIQVGPFWGQGVRMITGNEETDLGFGYHGGVLVRIPAGEQLSVLPSVSLARKGFYKFDFGWWNEDGGDVLYNQKLTYLDLYLPVKFQVAGVFNIQAGFQTGFLLEGEMVIDSYDYSGKLKKNIKDELKPVDFGFIAGAGVQFKNGIGIDLILNQGLTNIYEDEPESYIPPDFDHNYYFGSEFNGKNLLTTINVYYLFGYQKKPVSK